MCFDLRDLDTVKPRYSLSLRSSHDKRMPSDASESVSGISDGSRTRDWEARQARDDRLSTERSAAIRGVERYRDPYGRCIEVPVAGPDTRTYWDRRTGAVVTSDCNPFDKPVDWEELPHWQ